MILVYLYPNCADFEIDFTLHRLHQHGGYAIRTIAATKAPLVAQSGMTFLPDACIEDITDTSDVDALLIPGGPINNDQNEICALAKRLHDEGKLVCAICFGPQFLGRAGILDEHAFATSCPAWRFPEYGAYDPFPRANERQERVVVDGNLITAKGYAFVDFTREICRDLHVYDNEDQEREMIDSVKADWVQ